MATTGRTRVRVRLVAAVLYAAAMQHTVARVARGRGPAATVPPAPGRSSLGLGDTTLQNRHLEVLNGTLGDNGYPSICHAAASTSPIAAANRTGGQGIVFTVQSNKDDDVGLTVTSLGFFVDPFMLSSNDVDYEVYKLKDELGGVYASPNRLQFNPSSVAQGGFDYRLNKDYWDKIAFGEITQDDVEVSSVTEGEDGGDYYRIPFKNFQSTYIPGNNASQSFYITVKQGGSFVTVYPPDGASVNDILPIASPDVDVNGGLAPRILVGEGTVSSPSSDWPSSPYLFQAKAFVGKVFYETSCPTQAPSFSLVPSSSPTISESTAPSGSPSFGPSSQPSSMASDVPSLMPSQTPSAGYKIPVSSVVFIGVTAECQPGADLPEEELQVVTDVVADVAEEAAASDPNLIIIEVKPIGVECVVKKRARRLEMQRRFLPTGSSSIDFSMVITGEYRPPIRGQDVQPPDIGELTEESINRDPEAFVKDLQTRAGDSSPLQDVKDLSVESIVIPPETLEGANDLSELTFTKSPTRRPSPPPTIVPEDKTASILLVCIVCFSGLIVFLGAFQLFRYGERRAVQKRRKKMERAEMKKEEQTEKRLQQMEWDAKNGSRRAPTNLSVDGGAQWYPSEMKNAPHSQHPLQYGSSASSPYPPHPHYPTPPGAYIYPHTVNSQGQYPPHDPMPSHGGHYPAD